MIEVLEQKNCFSTNSIQMSSSNLDEEYSIEQPNDLENLLMARNRLQRDLESRIKKERMLLPVREQAPASGSEVFKAQDITAE